MRLDTSVNALHESARLFACGMLLLGSLACNSRYSHGRIPVDDDTEKKWEAGEKDAEEAGKQINPITPSKSFPDKVPVESLTTVLAHVDSSRRHGAGDKRLLSLTDSGRVRSANILAEIVLVKGSEYKAEKDFQTGWIPVAIVYRPPPTKGLSDAPYPKLKLSNTPVSWVFVHEVSKSKWIGSLVRPDSGSYSQLPLHVDVAESDHVEPVIGARFVWQDNDETIWTYCGGKCCKMSATQ